MRKFLLLGLVTLLAACEGGCQTQTGPRPVDSASAPAKRFPCRNLFKATSAAVACRDRVQAECFIDANGEPDPKCPVLAECDARIEEHCR